MISSWNLSGVKLVLIVVKISLKINKIKKNCKIVKKLIKCIANNLITKKFNNKNLL